MTITGVPTHSASNAESPGEAITRSALYISSATFSMFLCTMTLALFWRIRWRTRLTESSCPKCAPRITSIRNVLSRPSSSWRTAEVRLDGSLPPNTSSTVSGSRDETFPFVLVEFAPQHPVLRSVEVQGACVWIRIRDVLELTPNVRCHGNVGVPIGARQVGEDNEPGLQRPLDVSSQLLVEIDLVHDDDVWIQARKMTKYLRVALDPGYVEARFPDLSHDGIVALGQEAYVGAATQLLGDRCGLLDVSHPEPQSTISNEADVHSCPSSAACVRLSLIHISEPTRLGMISYAVF